MNVYDFDKTIFYPDSFQKFIKWNIIHHPKLLFTYCPKTFVCAILMFMKKKTITQAVEQLASFVKFIPNIDLEVEKFWIKNQKRMSKWYLDQKTNDDLIISASPEFFLKPQTDRLGVTLIGSQIDKKTGKLTGRCNYGKEKVKNLISHELFPENQIDRFYSDSYTDTPLAYCAEEAFIVTKKGTKVEPWPKLDSKTKKKVLAINL